MGKTVVGVLAQPAAAVVVMLGVSVFVRGVWLAWHPGAWMVGGAAIAAPALSWLYREVRSELRTTRTR